MADFETFDFDDSKILASLANIKKGVDEIGASNEQVGDDLKKSFADIGDTVSDVEKEMARLQAEMKEHIANQKKGKEANDQFRKSTKDLIGDVKILGVNLTQTVDHLKNKASALKSVTTSIGGTSKALNIFKVALISTGIGALVVLLGSLVAWLSKSQKGIDVMSKAMSALGAIMNVILDRLVKLGGAIVKVFSGDFSGAMKDAKGAVAGLTDEINKEARAAIALEDRVQKLSRAKRALGVESAESRLKIKELNLTVEDTTKSIKERLAAAEEAGTIERELLAKKLEAEKEELAILQEKAKLRNEQNDEQSEELANARIQLAQTEAESLELQTTLQNKKNGLLAEQQARIQAAVQAQKELRNEVQGLVDDFAEAAAEAERDRLSPEERIQAEEELSIKLIEKAYQLIQEKAKAAKVEVDLEKEKALIIEQIKLESYRKQIEEQEKANDEFAKIRRKELEQAQKDAELYVAAIETRAKRAKDTEKDILAIAPNVPPPAINLSDFEKFRGKLQLALGFGTDDEGNAQFQEFAASVGSAFSTMFNSITAGIATQIEENQTWIDDLRDRQDELAELIDVEKQRRDEGLAYNLEGKENELAELKRMEEQALKEQAELKKKAQAAQLLADGAAQVSNLITAGTAIIDGFAKVPILGIGLGIAAVASMFAFVVSMKAKAKETATRNFEGGHLKDILGPTASTEDEPHRGQGTYIHPDIIANANEYLVNGDSTLANLDHLHKVNAGKYDGVDLDGFLSQFSPEDMTRGFNHRQGLLDGYNAVNTSRVIRTSIGQAMNGMSRDIVNAIQNQPHFVAWGPGQSIRKYSGLNVADIRPA